MDMLVVAVLGALICTPLLLIPASIAMERGQSAIAFGLATLGLVLGGATPLLGVFDLSEGFALPLPFALCFFVATLAIVVLWFWLPTVAHQTEPRFRLSAPDSFALFATGLMLFGFFLLPWYTRQAVDIDAVPQSLMAQLYGGSIRPLDYNYVLQARLALSDFSPLMLVFLAGTIGALVVTLWGIVAKPLRANVGRYTLWAAGIVFAYYVIYMFQSNFHVPVIQKTDAGFWVGFYGMVILALQAVMPRPKVLRPQEKAQRQQTEVYDSEGVLTLHTENLTKSISNFGRALRRLRRDRLTLVAGGFLLFLMVVSFVSPTINELVLGKNPTRTNGVAALVPPGGCFTSRTATECYVLGSDQIGRDFLARILEGGRISLAIAFISAILTATVGTVLGMAAGYFGGVFDDFMNWVITTLNSLPQLYLLIAIAAILRPDPTTLVIVFVVTGWTGSMRLIRGQTIGTRNLDYVLAARALGASAWRIMFQHILPNMISILSVSLALGIGGVILAEAALSFLNLGISAATPTWGNMLSKVNENLQGFFRDAPHIVITPGVLITLTVLCLFVVGDGVRDAFDPTIND